MSINVKRTTTWYRVKLCAIFRQRTFVENSYEQNDSIAFVRRIHYTEINKTVQTIFKRF